MGLLGKIIKTGIHIASTPIDIIKDAATLGSQLTDEGDPYIARKGKKIQQDFRDMENEIDKL